MDRSPRPTPLSDVYAMGGVPRTALAIAALPKDGPGPDVIRQIFRGGYDTLREAGVVLLGGHTVTDPEIKFGYAVTGEIDPARVLTNAAREGGRRTAAHQAARHRRHHDRGKQSRAATGDHIEAATASMRRLNRDAAADVLRSRSRRGRERVHRRDRVQPHGSWHGEWRRRAGCRSSSGPPSCPPCRARSISPRGMCPAADGPMKSTSGRASGSRPAVPEAVRRLVFDPQTSGGLLIAVSPDAAADVIARLEARPGHGVADRTGGSPPRRTACWRAWSSGPVAGRYGIN